jgi:glyoxylase-like metal-dependent hydrolase (beta-lactamase superfamily II)
MKKILGISIAIILSISVSLFAKEHKFEKLAKNVYVMHGPLDEPNKENQGFMNNPVVVIGDKGVTIIDPGGSLVAGKMVLKQLKKITNKPIVAVFNTHIHGDHWLGNGAVREEYPKAIIYAHPLMIKQAKGGEATRWINLMNKLTNGATKDTKAVYPNEHTKNLQEIKIDGQTFIIHSPYAKAHTNTDIMIEHKNSKIMIMGDQAFVNRMGRFDKSSNMHGNIKVLKYAMAKKMKHYVPGHGKSGNAKQAIKPFLDYLLTIQKIVKKGYEDDLESYQIKKIALKKLKKYAKWHGFTSNLGPQIGKMYAEIEELDL